MILKQKKIHFQKKGGNITVLSLYFDFIAFEIASEICPENMKKI